MKIRHFLLISLSLTLLSSNLTAAFNKTGLSTITREYHKLSVLLQQCSIIYPQSADSYKQHFSAWLIRNRIALKKGEIESKKLSAKIAKRYDKNVLAYQLDLKKKYADFEQMKQDKICGYLPSIMAE